ncbi:hypothetical protein LCGC14_0376520 [marine sediment metagenome]|uniref:C2H2-type domain-containing protein n=1 Tax=marine sediment metagenome TaxID=412755 RepID=A0A0F9VQQ1_9ZZZZ
MLETIELTETFTKVSCGECGGVYALTQRYLKEKREHGGYWTCPYCKCTWGYNKELSELAQTKERLEREQYYLANERSRHDQTRASLRGHKAAKTRLKNRIANGVCPCCNRHFTNLNRHMTTMHPDFSEVTK